MEEVEGLEDLVVGGGVELEGLLEPGDRRDEPRPGLLRNIISERPEEGRQVLLNKYVFLD